MELVKSVSIENMVNQRAAVVARLNQALDSEVGARHSCLPHRTVVRLHLCGEVMTLPALMGK